MNNDRLIKPTSALFGLYGDDPLAMIRLPHNSFSSQSPGKYWQLNQNNQETEHIQTQTNDTKSGPNKQQKTHPKNPYGEDRQSLV